VSTPLPLRDQLKALENLQELDLQIDQIKRKKEGLPTALKTFDQGFNKAKAELTAKQTQIGDLEKQERQTRAAAELNKDRLTRAMGKLEGVHNTHEFQAANKEIDQIKKSNLGLEEQSKKIAADLVTERVALETLTAKLGELESQRAAQVSSMEGELSRFGGDIQKLTADRQAFTSKVDPRTLAQYDRIRVARGGIGIVPALAGRCKGCNMVIAPQLFNEIQKVSQIHQCPSCHRLLFSPDAGVGASHNATA
jgi:predicted  nucleic acid-binding Zn-ribbon protein